MAQSNPPRDALRNGHPPTAALPASTAATTLGEAEALEILRGENAGLQAHVDELEQMLAATVQEAEERWNERQREYEGLLEEKSEVIRALHLKIADLREHAAAGTRAPIGGQETPGRDELLKLQQELDEQRRQMQEDEESMMTQMRQMEMALARDRAELARQRAELQRLHSELKHDMESASRDAGLRERLSALQRRSGSAAARPAPNQDTPAPPTQRPKTPPPSSGADKGGSGIFRRLFGNG